MSENTIEQQFPVSLRRATRLVALARTEPVESRNLSRAVAALIEDLDAIRIHDGEEAHTQAVLIARYAQAIVGARHLHHLFPDITSVSIENSGTKDEFAIALVALDEEFNEVVLNEAQANVWIATVIDALLGQNKALVPEPGEQHGYIIDIADLYAAHPEPEDSADEVFGFDNIPTDVPPAEVEAAAIDGDKAIDFIQAFIAKKHINPLPDSVIRCAADEVVRRYKADGHHRHLDFGLHLTGCLLSRAMHAKYPQVTAMDACFEVVNGVLMLVTQCLDDTGEIVEMNPDDQNIVGTMTSSILLPNSILGQYVYDNDMPLHVGITEAMRDLPPPGGH